MGSKSADWSRIAADSCKLKIGRLCLFVDALQDEDRQLKAGDPHHAVNDMSNRPADNILPIAMSFMQHDAYSRPSKSIRRVLGRGLTQEPGNDSKFFTTAS